MENSEGWIALIKLIGGSLGIIIVGVAGWFTGKKHGPAMTDTDVVAATFTDRALMQQLIRSLDANHAAMLRIIALREAEESRLHDAEVERRVLRERGIKD